MKDQPGGPKAEIPEIPDIQFAVFNENEEITPQMYEEVEFFAAYVAEHKNTKIVSE